MAQLFLTACKTVHTAKSKKEGITFFAGSWKDAVAKAQEENKPIFMDVYTIWCPPCWQLKQKTFKDKTVGQFYNEHFINVSFDAERGEGTQLAANLHVTAYPTLIYFDKNGKPVSYTAGYLPPMALVDVGKEALQRLDK